MEEMQKPRGSGALCFGDERGAVLIKYKFLYSSRGIKNVAYRG